MQNKIYNVNDLIAKISLLRKKNLKVGLCHGLFDLVHPGHLYHLNEAKKLCDILIVTITADKFVKKNLKSPLFNQNLRAFFLSNLQMVDFVAISENNSSTNIIKKLKPNYYFKGKEYKQSDSIGNLKKELLTCKKNKVNVKFIGNRIFSSSNLISKSFYPINDKSLLHNVNNLTDEEKNLDKLFLKTKNLKILLIGEMIFDKYTFINTHGLSPKSSTISGSIKESILMEGGILSSRKFLKQFTDKVTCLSIVNENVKKDKEKFQILKKINKIIYSKNFPTITKERILQSEKNSDDQKKLLTLNHFTNKDISTNDENKILNFLKKNIHKFDTVMVQDFGHGLINKKIANFISKKSKFLSLNVQTNSMNYGFNIIDQKFIKTDLFSLDKKELQLFSKQNDIDFSKKLSDLKKKMKSKIGFLTIGDNFTLINGYKKNIKIPALETKVVDSVGAGDTFHSFATLLSSVTKNDFLITFLSQIAGSLAVRILGNSRPPSVNEIKNTFNFYANR
tara:strand:+ start:928 stop:2448 length:1521 start_codon:yes stop_codon:yes gene_type:complete